MLNAMVAGILIDKWSTSGAVRAVRRLWPTYSERAATRRHVEQFNWTATTAGQLDLFSQVVAEGYW